MNLPSLIRLDAHIILENVVLRYQNLYKYAVSWLTPGQLFKIDP